ncbi:hypothetical protein BJY59DRAFT_161952 [Rhodotorula toruloides]
MLASRPPRMAHSPPSAGSGDSLDCSTGSHYPLRPTTAARRAVVATDSTPRVDHSDAPLDSTRRRRTEWLRGDQQTVYGRDWAARSVHTRRWSARRWVTLPLPLLDLSLLAHQRTNCDCHCFTGRRKGGCLTAQGRDLPLQEAASRFFERPFPLLSFRLLLRRILQRLNCSIMLHTAQPALVHVLAHQLKPSPQA